VKACTTTSVRVAFLVDTNLLLRSADRSSSLYGTAVTALRTLRRRGEELYITPQNIVEFWNVYTRPIERNGLGHTAVEAEMEVNHLKGFFPLLLDTPSIYPE